MAINAKNAQIQACSVSRLINAKRENTSVFRYMAYHWNSWRSRRLLPSHPPKTPQSCYKFRLAIWSLFLIFLASFSLLLYISHNNYCSEPGTYRNLSSSVLLFLTLRKSQLPLNHMVSSYVYSFYFSLVCISTYNHTSQTHTITYLQSLH